MSCKQCSVVGSHCGVTRILLLVPLRIAVLLIIAPIARQATVTLAVLNLFDTLLAFFRFNPMAPIPALALAMQ